jgi:O-antigen/teichoic acid export membrane protein
MTAGGSRPRTPVAPGRSAVDRGLSPRSYGRGAAVLSVGIGLTGLITFSYFSLASYSLPEAEYGRITLLWSAMFITVSVLYRPVEQLLSRTIADQDARGIAGSRHLRVAATIQLALGLAFAVVALVLRGPIQDDLFDGSATLYWILVVGVLAYAASYFARGFLAGHHQFGLYGGLVLMEACSRCLFALAVAIGIAEGQSAVALGMAAAPIVSLAVVPPALARRLAPEPAGREVDAQALDAAARDEPSAREPQFTLARGTGFAAGVLVIMLCEQTFLNAGPLLIEATEEGARGAALAGIVFNVLLIARAPLQLFQAVQTSILPHLTRLRAGGETDPFRRSVNLTLFAIAAFAACVALVMLIAGPLIMDLLFGGEFDYERGGLVLVALGMGLYLVAATLNQALLAHGRAAQASVSWALAALAFVLFLLLADFDDRVLQVELAFAGAAAALSASLYALYRRA